MIRPNSEEHHIKVSTPVAELHTDSAKLQP